MMSVNFEIRYRAKKYGEMTLAQVGKEETESAVLMLNWRAEPVFIKEESRVRRVVGSN